MKIPPRIANILINSLKGGVVPRVGLEYVTVGRAQEISAILHDIDLIADGGASFRFIVGKYGSGKSFLLQTIRNYATAKGFAVVDADLSPERRFSGTKGQGLATYKELIQNLSTKSKLDGGALPLVLERWISNIQSQVAAEMIEKAAPPLPEGSVAGLCPAERRGLGQRPILIKGGCYNGFNTKTNCSRRCGWHLYR